MMMQWTSVVVLVTLVSVTSALKCYHCNDCGNSRGTVIDCGEDADVCMVSIPTWDFYVHINYLSGLEA